MAEILEHARAWLARIEFGALSDLIDRGGPIVVVLLVLSVFAAAVALLKAAQFVLYGVGGMRRPVRNALAQWQAGQPVVGLDALSARQDGFCRIVAAAIDGRLCSRPDQMLREDVERLALEHLAGLKAYLRVLEAVSQLAPLIGLFGTVIGMMGAFQALQAAGADADPAALAGGIWVALITTAVGLAVAIPTSFALYWFEGRIAREQQLIESAVTRVLVRETATGVQGSDVPGASGGLADAAE